MDTIRKHIKSCVEGIKAEGKKRFNISDMEKYVVKKTGGNSKYESLGGYSAFYSAVIQLQKDRNIMPVEASQYNGMIPMLKTRWGVICENKATGWSTSFIIQVSDCLDMSGYIRNPDWQTEEEKKHIESIYSFLRHSGKREWASCEERCLELFGNEKFLSTAGRRVLTRLNITYDQLKMKKYGQMFSYWISDKKELKKVIILENHSTFFTFKRCAEEKVGMFGLLPDILIFGDGKRIVKSLEFLDEIAHSQTCEIKYFGDIDPEGWLIYKLLCEKYIDLNISLFMPAYEFLLNSGKDYQIGDIMQSTNIEILKYIISEFKKESKACYIPEIKRLWDERRRIPQELITYEKFKNGL